ncbi:LrgB family protein [Zunongwangia atlantica]|uniref:LrgB-like family protein n=1 Tax=Zunongwangia atlantica 22II14-10F7 TaxID=1185767 RepID=A0A1Y1T7S5_9FLAO|nr:LrgB family protein [Zunongwangia atlantica]ORL46772.1 lrgB-like family protein [Zunongwangia atlantica 22II14-10F7]
MKAFFALPIFGVTLTLMAYFLSGKLKEKFDFVIFNRVLVSAILIIAVLFIFNIDFETYNNGAKYISFFLGPSVVALGVFLYEKLEEVKRDLKIFLISVFVGGIVGIISVVLFLVLLNAPEIISRSLAAKSVTTPIAIEITKITEGIPEITAGIVIITGILGNAFGPVVLHKLGVKNKKAVGTALGTGAHGIGTARAFEISASAGTYSGLAMCFNGIITALLAPYILAWLLSFTQ